MRLLVHHELPQMLEIFVDSLEAGLQHTHAIHVQHVDLKHHQGDVQRIHLHQGLINVERVNVRHLSEQEEKADDVLGVDQPGQLVICLRRQPRRDLL